jgi:tetratricopeptide (TPR) repeat protein
MILNGLKGDLNKKKAMKNSPLCDPAGIRTQDPYIKSVLLYQLSYGILPLFKTRMQNYEKITRKQNLICKLFLFIFFILIQSLDSKAQNDIAKNADSLYSAKNYLEASKLYEAIFDDPNINKEAICLKLANINENLGNFPKVLFYLNSYYNLNPKDEIFEKMNLIALENKYSGFERNDLNFILMIYQQYYTYILYLLILIGSLILFILFKKKKQEQSIGLRHKIVMLFYLAFLFLIINVPGTYKAAIVKNDSFLRKDPTSASPIVGNIGPGNRINVFGKEDIWLKIFWKNGVYYINSYDTFVLEN